MTSGPHQVSWAAGAIRSLDTLPEKVATACVEFVFGSLAENPHRVGKALRFDLDGLHSARRGDFRVVYEIDDDDHRVTIVAIDHRDDVYRPR